MRIGLAQIDSAVGDIEGNFELISSAIAEATRKGAQVVALPECAINGYPPEDLVFKESFVRAGRAAVDRVADIEPEALVIVGFVDRSEDHLFNAAAICHGGRVQAIYHKQLLPNYGVFDERRHFSPGRGHTLIETEHGVVGVCICEDAWSEDGPLVSQGDLGAQVVININASPYHKGKLAERAAMLGARARAADAAIVYVNAVGGQDELVFDGGSMVLDPHGQVVCRLPQFKTGVMVADVPLGRSAEPGETVGVTRLAIPLRKASGSSDDKSIAAPLGAEEEIYQALQLGLADYARKNGFSKAVIGLSGGIDSSLTAAIAADALGSDNVLGVAMPSEFSSSHSIEDAKSLAAALDIELLEISIRAPFSAFGEALATTFGPVEPGLAEENLQARIRGNLLMAISNRYGHLVIATGNKSELACGYATLYGDMAGGFALLKDVFKTEVYALARWRNSIGSVIPDHVLTKPPSAELRRDQKDSDSLPPYEILDPILEAYIEANSGIDEIAAAGTDRALAAEVVALVDRAEYKRRQAPPGPKVTTRAFGRDRRLPISNAWREKL